MPASPGGDPVDPHAQIVPGGLAGDRVGIGVGIAAIRRQQLGDQVVEQEALAELGRVGSEVPGARCACRSRSRSTPCPG